MRNLVVLVDGSVNLTPARKRAAQGLVEALLTQLTPAQRFALVVFNEGLAGYEFGNFCPLREKAEALAWLSLFQPEGGRAAPEVVLQRLGYLSEPARAVMLACGPVGTPQSLSALPVPPREKMVLDAVAIDCSPEAIAPLCHAWGGRAYGCDSLEYQRVLQLLLTPPQARESREGGGDLPPSTYSEPIPAASCVMKLLDLLVECGAQELVVEQQLAMRAPWLEREQWPDFLRIVESWRLVRAGISSEIIPVLEQLAVLGDRRQALLSFLPSFSILWDRVYRGLDGFSLQTARVALAFSRAAASSMGWDAMTLEGIWVGALMTNLGFAEVPPPCDPPGPGGLSDHDYASFLAHPSHSHLGLSRIPFVWPEVMPIARHYLEKWDGSGTPDGLAGDQIPAVAHCVGLCNFYCALRLSRPGRPRITHSQAIGIIERESGRFFGPWLVNLFVHFEPEIASVLE